MAQHDHLPLVRSRAPVARRKHGGGGPPPTRGGGHGGGLRRSVQTAVADQAAAKPAAFLDPSLMLRVHVDGHVADDEWGKLGLRVVSNDEDRTVLLFSSTGDLAAFQQRLAAYDAPIPEGQKSPRYAGLVGRIDDVAALAPKDRLGPKLKAAGFAEPDNLQDVQTYLVDIELWEFGSRRAREDKTAEIERFVTAQDGAVHDIYIGPAITVMRVEARGQVLRPLLGVPEVAAIDLPPQPDLEAQTQADIALDAAPVVRAVADGAPVIGILDSGVNDHPLLNNLIAARLSGEGIADTADVWGHGTRVAGTALFGDLKNGIRDGYLQPAARLVMAKVVDDRGRFPERRTVQRVMDDAIRSMRVGHGCRIFVLSLGDLNANLPRGRVGAWAATLDALARELDVLIFVSTGNRMPRPRGGPAAEEAVTAYPGYLLEEQNRLAEPAGAANVVTVGAVSGGTGLDARHDHDVHVRPVTNEAGEPSPFTRIGPGAGGIVKPDFVDLGGTLVFDAPSASLRGAPLLPAAGVITLDHEYTQQLLTTGHGTSYAAPMLANKAARLLTLMPLASANLLRALLVGAAARPDAFERRLAGLSDADRIRVGGHGLVDSARAAYSDDHRVVLYAEGALEQNQFAIYRIPIPEEFRSGGDRTIRVSLAYDPPVRRTRQDYVGTKVDFRLLRGYPEADVFEHFRERNQQTEGPAPDVANRFKCNLEPGPDTRAGNTLQTASITFKRDTVSYGGEYHLVVRCISGWAEDQALDQRFAVVVELEHRAQVQIYERIREQIRVRATI